MERGQIARTPGRRNRGSRTGARKRAAGSAPGYCRPHRLFVAPTVIGVADTLCAYGVSKKWPEGANGFTEAELKCNFMGTVQSGAIACTAELLHGGRTTQVWDAKVTNEQTGKLLAAFRCTQIILCPR